MVCPFADLTKRIFHEMYHRDVYVPLFSIVLSFDVGLCFSREFSCCQILPW